MNVNQELATLPILPTILTNLTRAGLMVIDDVVNLTPSHLARDANISSEQASELLQKIQSYKSFLPVKPVSVWEIFQKEHDSPSIVTFSESLDDMLDGGVPLTKITEFCGAPGTGKTQMCLQLSVAAQIPKDLGGQEGEVIYIDTEGSFIMERFIDIARATIDHCGTIPTQLASGKYMEEFTMENVLRGIHYFRCQDQYELAAVLHQVPEMIGVHPKVKLLVVDNISSPVRYGFEGLLAQNQFLSSVSQTFVKIAKQFEIAVVLTNQMTTKIDFTQSGKSHLIPSLGEIWSHVPNTRIILLQEDGQRLAWLHKSPNRKETMQPFQITTSGIRDIIEADADDHSQPQTSGLLPICLTGKNFSRDEDDADNGNPNKRARIS